MSEVKQYLNVFRDRTIEDNFIASIDEIYAEIARYESDFSIYVGTVQITYSSNGSELSIMDRNKMIENSSDWKIKFQIEAIEKEIKTLQTTLQKLKTK